MNRIVLVRGLNDLKQGARRRMDRIVDFGRSREFVGVEDNIGPLWPLIMGVIQSRLGR